MTRRREAHWRSALLRWLRDPLCVFLLIGAGVFVLHGLMRDDESRVITVTPAQVDRFVALWRTQTGRAPSEAELRALIDDHVREEILVREARRLRLDEGDVIVRRRLAQKLSFLSDDATPLAAADEAALLAYFETNRQHYETPAAITFSHIYFSAEPSAGEREGPAPRMEEPSAGEREGPAPRMEEPSAGDREGPAPRTGKRREDAAAEAARALATLNPDAWRTTGDPFMLGRTYAYANPLRISKDFGDDFAAVVMAMPADGTWRGPVQSAYGFHLVRVDAHTPAKGADYASVAARVAADFDEERRQEAARAYFEGLKASYTVVLP